MFHYKYETMLMARINFNNCERFISFFSLSVIESFRDFCKSEILTGENLYDAGNVHGLQVSLNSIEIYFFFAFLKISV